MAGRIVVLNGAPRSGKSSIVAALDWRSVGVDSQSRRLPEELRPGIGLRPGGERPDLEAVVVRLYGELFDEVVALAESHDVVVDVGIHDAYSRPLGVLRDAARRLHDRAAWLVGVHCSPDVVLARRAAAPDGYEASEEAVRRWDLAVHDPGIYDLELDTTSTGPEACAAEIERHVASVPPTAFPRLARFAG